MATEQGERHAELNERKWDARAPTYERLDYGYHRIFQRVLIHLVDARPGIRVAKLEYEAFTNWTF